MATNNTKSGTTVPAVRSLDLVSIPSGSTVTVYRAGRVWDKVAKKMVPSGIDVPTGTKCVDAISAIRSAMSPAASTAFDAGSAADRASFTAASVAHEAASRGATSVSVRTYNRSGTTIITLRDERRATVNKALRAISYEQLTSALPAEQIDALLKAYNASQK